MQKTLSLATFALCTLPAMAQQQYDDAHPYKIHVYTNLMEVSALVLDGSNQPFKHVDPSRFAISLDSGPDFPPSYARLEGDDPISLSILLDLSDEDISDALPLIQKAIPSLAPASLHPGDHVSLYAMDCVLIRTADDLAASEASLKSAVDNAIAYPSLHDQKKRKPSRCSNSNRLWDSIGKVLQDLSDRPGRKVLLLLTNGNDGKSNTRWAALSRYSAARGIAVFALSYGGNTSTKAPEGQGTLENLCASTSGIALHLDAARDLSNSLPHIMKLVRGRYILQFHRPSNATRGIHDVDVMLKHTSAVIRVAGTTVPLPSTEELSGPDGLPLAPITSVMGTRRPLPPRL